mmetsp:Transcript_5886/g.16730  ORF Transcript_5886/g.16730 Transcript_5886/m.16730 type:complete len:248 (+) Transcript_5886:1135-1878(+)
MFLNCIKVPVVGSRTTASPSCRLSRWSSAPVIGWSIFTPTPPVAPPRGLSSPPPPPAAAAAAPAAFGCAGGRVLAIDIRGGRALVGLVAAAAAAAAAAAGGGTGGWAGVGNGLVSAVWIILGMGSGRWPVPLLQWLRIFCSRGLMSSSRALTAFCASMVCSISLIRFCTFCPFCASMVCMSLICFCTALLSDCCLMSCSLRPLSSLSLACVAVSAAACFSLSESISFRSSALSFSAFSLSFSALSFA